MSQGDPRRRIPRTDDLLGDPRLAGLVAERGRDAALVAIRAAQQRAREGGITPDQVAAEAAHRLEGPACSMQPVLNATGVVVHTNLGRAALSPAAVAALTSASSYTDVELDLRTGARGRRGEGVREALLKAVPAAEDALVVNNGAAALVLATTALATGREVVVSRGEMVEIGDGFRLPDLIASTGARLREVGTTNRTHREDYERAVGPLTGCILTVHPSNFRVEGFVSRVDPGRVQGLGVPVVADIGSGLLAPDPTLPDEPDAASTLASGADLVTASGDKLLGGPQAGLVLGRHELVQRLRRHPLARALRVDKLTLAALEATLRGPAPPVTEYLHADPETLRRRAEAIAARLGADVVPVEGRVGGGGAPGVPLPGWAVRLPEMVAPRLRAGDPVVLARVGGGHCLVDPRCVSPADDEALVGALLAALGPDTAPRVR